MDCPNVNKHFNRLISDSHHYVRPVFISPIFKLRRITFASETFKIQVLRFVVFAEKINLDLFYTTDTLSLLQFYNNYQ